MPMLMKLQTQMARLVSVLVVAAGLLPSASALASPSTGCDKHDPRSPVPVFVVTESPEGFTAPKEVADSTRDLVKKLKGKRSLCLSKTPEDALVVVEILGRGKAEVTAHWAGVGRGVSVSARMSAGTFTTVITGSAVGGTLTTGGAWGKAAGKLAEYIEDWIKANRGRLIEG